MVISSLLCSVDVFFVLVDENGVPLSGLAALQLLEESNVLARLREYGYQATGYATVERPTESAQTGNHERHMTIT